MELIVAVYDDWGIGCCGTQPIALSADRKFFREMTKGAMVIGGGSIYRQMLPLCDTAYITKVHCTVPCDTYFPNLDEAPDWALAEVLQSGEENGIAFEMCVYKRKGTA